MKRITLGSLFDGIGGFTLAAQRCGIKTLWASEIEPACVSITKRHFSGVKHLGDITKIHGGEIPPVDIISFGSPCQDLSTAGRQRGLSGERSGLFMAAVRIINEMRYATRGKYPAFIIRENVPGAFSSNNGEDFRTVIEILTNSRVPMPRSDRWAIAGMAGGCAGGANIAWRQLDSQFWGVPQRRKRIFLVGDFRGKRAAQILFECESELGYVGKGGTQGQDSSAVTGNCVEASSGNCLTSRSSEESVADFGRAGDRVRINAEKSATLITTSGGWGASTGLYLLSDGKTAFALQGNMIGRADKNGPRGSGVNENVCFTLTAGDRHAVAEISAGFTPNSFGGYKAGVGTLRANGGDSGGGSETLVVQGFAPAGHGGYAEGIGTLRASAGNHGHSSSNLLVQAYSFDSLSSNSMKSKNPFSGCREVEIARTIDASGPDSTKNQGGIAIVDTLQFAARVRKLTPLECERLQGFPDYRTKYNADGAVVADTPRYTALGNSLTVPCAERIFRGIVAAVAGVTV
ncbi:MAG: DNA cytosine methyltransferase [Defluviitaleaceae bacterium]|nr:DNA cytosine methyltransferase [Defluviitaleaceae bacterium]